MSSEAAQIAGVAAGAPFVAHPPAAGPRPSAPVVVAWHLMAPPRTERALAAALPLAGLDAWRIYLGLPLCGSRKPPGGDEELMRLGYEDAVLNLQGPIISQAAEELDAALADVRRQLGLGDGPVGLLGGSVGAAVAQLVLAEGSIDVRAAVLVSPIVQLRPAVEAMGRYFGVTYPWSEPSLEVARRMDFVARADEIAERGQPAVLLVVGADDDAEGFHQPAELLVGALASRYADPERIALEVIPGMSHAVAEEPGDEAAPQTEPAVAIDGLAARWLGRHLTPFLVDDPQPGDR